MQKILDKYKANPTNENLAKLIAHANKHPFSVCVMPLQDQKFLHTLLAWHFSVKGFALSSAMSHGLIGGLMTIFKFQKVTYNGVKGWFADRYVDGLYLGKQFGKTKKQAMQAFDN